jgi:hypothetical protein
MTKIKRKVAATHRKVKVPAFVGTAATVVLAVAAGVGAAVPAAVPITTAVTTGVLATIGYFTYA